MRAYALCNRSITVTLLVGVLSLSPLGVDVVCELRSVLLSRNITFTRSQLVGTRTSALNSMNLFPFLPPVCLYQLQIEVNARTNLMFVISFRRELQVVMDAQQSSQLCELLYQSGTVLTR